MKTVRDLRLGVLKSRITRRRAEAKLKEIRDLIDVLLEAKDDAKRMGAFKALGRRLGLTSSDLVVWSAIANPSPAVRNVLRTLRFRPFS